MGGEGGSQQGPIAIPSTGAASWEPGGAWRTRGASTPQGEATAKATEEREWAGLVLGAGGGLRRLQDATCQGKSFWAELTPAPPWYPGDPLATQHEGATPGKTGWAQHVRVPLSQLFNILMVPQAPHGRKDHTVCAHAERPGLRGRQECFPGLQCHVVPQLAAPPRSLPLTTLLHVHVHVSPHRLSVDCAPSVISYCPHRIHP